MNALSHHREGSPMEYLMRRVPQVEFNPNATQEQVSGHAYRALAFMEQDERDVLALQAGVLLSSWTLPELEKRDRASLQTDLALFHEAWDRHRPSKFKDMLVALQEQDSLQDRRDRTHLNLITDTYQAIALQNQQIYNQVRTNFTTSTTNNDLFFWPNEVATHNSIILSTATRGTNNSWFFTNSSTAPITTMPTYFTSTWEDMTVSYFDRELEYIAKSWQNRVPKREDRKQVRRQMDLLASVLDNPNDVHVFLKGDSLEIASDLTGLKYRFKRKAAHQGLSAIAKVSHYSTPYHLEVYSQDDVFLTSLCVYIKETPMLDQLAAMIMYIRSGEEAELLQTANFIQVGDTQRLHDELVRMGLVNKAKPYHNRRQDVYRPEQVHSEHQDLSDTFLLKSYPEIALLRDRVQDYHFLKLFSRHQLH